MRWMSAVLPAFAVLAWMSSAPSAGAGISTTTVKVGGPGGFSSCGPEDPPTLCDGVTLASATFVFTYDDVTRILAVEATNTSPVIPGVPNPLLAEIYFNTPALAVTDSALTSQSAADGTDAPTFGFAFDPDLNDGSNAVTAAGFCAFNGRIEPSQSLVAGGIANAAADTINAPAGSWVYGPVTFTFTEVGPVSSGVKASSHARAFSQIPPGNFRVNVVGKFKSGGVAGASGSISNGPTCEAGNWLVGEPRIGCSVNFVASGAAGCAGCFVLSTDPGPITFPNPPFGNVTVPVGHPVYPLFVLTVPSQTVLPVPVQIPNLPGLVGITLYVANILIDPGTGQISAGESLSFTIGPPGPCS